MLSLTSGETTPSQEEHNPLISSRSRHPVEALPKLGGIQAFRKETPIYTREKVCRKSRLVAKGIARILQVLVAVNDVLVQLVTLDVSPKAICEEAQRSESFVRSKRSALRPFMP
jgi:hypothetical protein